jgi:hypothetical protein
MLFWICLPAKVKSGRHISIFFGLSADKKVVRECPLILAGLLLRSIPQKKDP